jgi:hypothetical protein
MIEVANPFADVVRARHCLTASNLEEAASAAISEPS